MATEIMSAQTQTTASVPWARRCFGLDLRENECVIARGDRKGKRVDCTLTTAAPAATAREQIPENAVCAAALSPLESVTRWVDVPYGSLSRARKVLPTVLDIQLPFALEQCGHVFLGLHKTSSDSTRALAVVAKVDAIEAKLATLAEIGVDPVVLDHEGLAAWSQATREVRFDDETGWQAVVHLGEKHSTLVVGESGQFRTAHGLRRADAAQITRLVRARIAEFVAGDEALERAARVQWVWTGPEAANQELLATLREEVEKTWAGSSSVVNDPGGFLARALATRALLAGPLRCNLRTASLTHDAVSRRSSRLGRAAGVALLVAGLVLTGSGFGVKALTHSREAAVDNAIQDAASRIAGYPVEQKGSYAARVARQAAATRQEQLRPFVRAFEPSLTETIAGIVDAGKQAGLQYELMSVGTARVLVSGLGPKWNSAEPLLQQLRTAGYPVELTRTDAVAGERTPFHLTSGGSDE